jgi:hypothetical protein
VLYFATSKVAVSTPAEKAPPRDQPGLHALRIKLPAAPTTPAPAATTKTTAG